MTNFQNMKRNNISYICKFPPAQNTNQFKLGFIFRGLELAKRKLWMIVSLLVISVPVYFYISYRLTLIGWGYSGIELQLVDIIYPSTVIAIIAIAIGLLVKSYATPSSGEVRITRNTSDSVDGYGGARARDFSYSPPSHSSKGGFPVSLRQKRKRTATFREGAKDHDDERSGETS